MRSVMILFTLLSMCFVASYGASEVVETQHTISLAVGPGPFVFGSSVLLKVSYRNQGTDPWVIPAPKESVSAIVRYRLVGSKDQPSGYSLGRVTMTSVKRPDGAIMRTRVVPSPKPVSIAPGESYDFEISLERDWSGHVVPGLWSVWIEDEGVRLTSNKVEIPLRFTTTSIRACLQKASDEKRDRFQRKFYSKWVHEVISDFDLRWPSDDTPEQERQNMEVRIKKEIQAAKEFLSDKSNERVVEAAMENINRKVKEGGDSVLRTKCVPRRFEGRRKTDQRIMLHD